jgi:hypothetical protein
LCPYASSEAIVWRYELSGQLQVPVNLTLEKEEPVIMRLGGPHSPPRYLGEEGNVSESAVNYTIALFNILFSLKLSSGAFRIDKFVTGM